MKMRANASKGLTAIFSLQSLFPASSMIPERSSARIEKRSTDQSALAYSIVVCSRIFFISIHLRYRSFRVDQTASQPTGHRFRSRARTKLPQYRADVKFDRVFG